MSLAKILAVVGGGPGSEAAVTAALDLGQRFSARVELLHVEIDAETSMPMIGEGMSGAAVEQLAQNLRAEAQGRLREAQRLFEVYCVAPGLPLVEPDGAREAGAFAVCFRHVVDREVDQVLRYGRLSDLIVMARPGADSEAGLSAAFDAALFDSGRAVLLVPAEPVTGLGATVAVAWDRSREAARAAGAALPILAQAEKIVILTAREGGNDAEPSELAHYLALHGLDARTWAFTPGPGSLGEALLGEAEKAEADLLVMGAYGHSRLREMVLGGVTRDILGGAAIPVLMVH